MRTKLKLIGRMKVDIWKVELGRETKSISKYYVHIILPNNDRKCYKSTISVHYNEKWNKKEKKSHNLLRMCSTGKTNENQVI